MPYECMRTNALCKTVYYTPSPAEAEFDVLTAGFRTIQLPVLAAHGHRDGGPTSRRGSEGAEQDTRFVQDDRR